jgi:hypothetical protein
MTCSTLDLVARDAAGATSTTNSVLEDGLYRVSKRIAAESVPPDEMWLYRNARALTMVERGLEAAAEGRGRVLSFARYLDEE